MGQSECPSRPVWHNRASRNNCCTQTRSNGEPSRPGCRLPRQRLNQPETRPGSTPPPAGKRLFFLRKPSFRARAVAYCSVLAGAISAEMANLSPPVDTPRTGSRGTPPKSIFEGLTVEHRLAVVRVSYVLLGLEPTGLGHRAISFVIHPLAGLIVSEVFD